MSHYFIEDQSLEHDIKQIRYTYAGHTFLFTTDAGVFSKDRVDYATDILLQAIPALSGTLLDMGCGYGCIGIVLAKTYALELTQADVNPAAVRLTEKNSRENGVEATVLQSDCFGSITENFDTIVINPPIHAGKAVTYKMYEESFTHLRDDGRLYIVTLKKHGAESTGKKLMSVFGNCETIYKKKGYYVFCCRKAA